MTDTTLESSPSPPKIYYGWIVTLVAALAMLCTFPGRSLGRGLITEPLLADLHLPRIDYGLITLIATLIGSTFSLLTGPLIDRLGTRIVLTANALLLGLTVLAMANVTSTAQLAVTLTLTLGLGQSALSVVSIAIVGKWFQRRIDSAMALYAALVSFSFMAAFGIVQLLVEHHGWRTTWSAIGYFLLLILTPLSYLIVRNTPESLGLTVDGLPSPTLNSELTTLNSALQGATLRQAASTPAFWIFLLASALFNLLFTGVTVFAQAIVEERGFYDAASFRNATMTLAFGGILANFLGGYLARKIPHGKLMSLAMLAVTAALLILPLGHGPVALYSYALLMGIAGGVVTVVFFACWNKAFGRAHLGKIQGAAQVATVLASAIGPYLLAQGEAHQGSLTKTFLYLAPLFAILAIAAFVTPVPVRSESRL